MQEVNYSTETSKRVIEELTVRQRLSNVGEHCVGLDGSHQIINAGKELQGEGGVDIYQSAKFCPGSQIRKRYRWYLNTEEVTNSNQGVSM